MLWSYDWNPSLLFRCIGHTLVIKYKLVISLVMYFICHMVVIRPVLDICWSYVAIYMYMTNILIVVHELQLPVFLWEITLHPSGPTGMAS